MELNRYALIDSNVWIGLHNSKDTLHEKANKIFRTLEKTDRGVVVSNFIVQEVFTLLTNKMSHTEALKFYWFISKHKLIDQIDMNSEFIRRTIKFIEQQKLTKPLGLTDYSNLYLALTFGFELITFDEQLAGIYRQLKK
ncbi:MAG: PIN domain-containing protein [Patescibacteria group bacterium]|jgi:predicted nucleic acid-binding protein